MPDEFNGKKGAKVDFVDIGCGYGGLLCTILLFTNSSRTQSVFPSEPQSRNGNQRKTGRFCGIEDQSI